MMNIDKLRQYERIKLSWLRNNGDNELVAVETGLSHEYVRKVTWKLKKQEEHDTKVRVANDLMREIYFGIKARTQMAIDALRLIHGREFATVSVCHKVPVREGGEAGDKKAYCLECGKETETYTLNQVDTFQLRRQFIEDWRREAEFTLRAAVEMGYVIKDGPQQPANIYKQQILVVSGDKQTTARLSEQSPADRQKVIQDMENEIFSISERLALIDVQEAQGKNGQQEKGRPFGSGVDGSEAGTEIPPKA